MQRFCGETESSANRKELSMKSVRRALCGVFAVCFVGGAAVVATTAGSATASSDPCAASEIARTIGSVATNTGNYLDMHPQTNMALTAAAQQPGAQGLTAVKSYLDANPQVGKDLSSLQQPLQILSSRCRLPLTLPQVLQSLQAAQNDQLPNAAALPGVLPSAQSTAASTAGPLPGPTTTAPAPALR
jgi:hemophore